MDYSLIITILSLGGSALIAFVTVQVSQKFYGKAILDADIEIKALIQDKEKKSSEIAKLQTMVEHLQQNSVSKDEVAGLKNQMEHIEKNISNMDSKLDRITDIMLNKK